MKYPIFTCLQCFWSSTSYGITGTVLSKGFPGCGHAKEPTCQCRRPKGQGFKPWEDPLEEEMTTQVFLPGKSHGQRSMAVYSPLGRKESDMTEVT